LSSASPDLAPDPEPPDSTSRTPLPGRRLHWWREVLFVLAFYGVYSLVRNTQGSATVSSGRALSNALRVIRLEKALGLWHELGVQRAFVRWETFIEFWNLFYGTFHFGVTIVALVVLFRRFPDRYPRWRNTLAATTGLALVGFATYPLMPPRLLPASYHFVDTLRTYGSLWSFDSGPMSRVSNQYAAMPSLHFAWSVWSALVLVPTLRRPWARTVVALYPLATLFAIVVTANHYVLDAVGGAFVLSLGAVAGFTLAGVTGRRTAAGHPADSAVPNRA